MKTIDSTEKQIIVRDKHDFKTNEPIPEMLIQEKFSPDFRARLATQLVERWGLVACDVLDEENTAGRQKARLFTPAEVVDRACNTADLLVDELHNRGWMTAVPSFDEASDMLRGKKS
jgi:hypothetical protein